MLLLFSSTKIRHRRRLEDVGLTQSNKKNNFEKKKENYLKLRYDRNKDIINFPKSVEGRFMFREEVPLGRIGDMMDLSLNHSILFQIHYLNVK